jgi:hypothetical protein
MNRFGLSKSLIQAARDVHVEGNSPDKNVPHVPVKANSTSANLRKREKEISGSHKANVHKEEAVAEALKGGQKKLDKNHNGKLDGQDFKMIRKEETVPFEGPYDKKSPAKDKNVAKNAARKAMKKIKTSMDRVKTGGSVKEEVEQVDEVSKATLASYSQKAAKQVKGNQSADPDKLRKRTNREQGIKQAYNKNYGYKTKVPATEEVQFSPEELERIEAIVGTNK